MASPRRPTPRPGPPPIEHALAYSRTSGARGGRGPSSGGGVPSGSVTRSPDSQPCGLRAGRRGPTPPEGTPPPDATRPAYTCRTREFLGRVAELRGETHQVGVAGAHQCVAELAITPQQHVEAAGRRAVRVALEAVGRPREPVRLEDEKRDGV